MGSPGRDRYDVVVIGGGAAGVGAALGAARQGARTLLVERYGFLGGAATNALVLSYCGFFVAGPQAVRAVGGIGWELLSALQRLGFDIEPVRSKSGNWIVLIDVEAVKFALDTLASAPDLDLRLHTRLVSSGVEGGRIVSVRLADHAGLHDIESAAFVDASGEASLSAFSGATFSQAGGPGACLQPASFPVRLGGVPPEVALDQQRLRDAANRYNAAATRPLARADGGVLVRLPMSGDVWWMGVDIATEGLHGHDLARAEKAARRQAWEFLPFLREMPGFRGAHILATGPQLGIRETRRPRSRGDVTAADGRAGRRRDDGIGRGCWPMEVHEAPGRSVFEPIGGEGFFDIPYSAIQAQEIGNLRLAGRVTGADPQAYGSTRVMGTAFATGQASGVSAALQSQRGALPDAMLVRRVLAAQHAIV